MPRTARQALAALLIALHAMISLCGPGLHAAPGLGHVGRAGIDRKPGGHHELTRLAAASSEHCPICDFFSQGQLPLPTAIHLDSQQSLPIEPNLSRALAPRPPPLSSRSRAPPLGDSRIV